MQIDGTVILFGLIFLAAVVWVIAEVRIDLLLRLSGVDAEGHITKLNRTSSSRGSSFAVEYQFSADSPKQSGGEYKKRQAVSNKHFRRLSMGASVPIRYWTENPAVSQLAGDHTDHSGRDLALFVAGFTFILWLITITRPFKQ